MCSPVKFSQSVLFGIWPRLIGCKGVEMVRRHVAITKAEGENCHLYLYVIMGLQFPKLMVMFILFFLYTILIGGIPEDGL